MEESIQQVSILEPSGMERGNFEDTLAACEDEPLKSEKEPSSRLSDDVKIAVLMQKTSGTSPAECLCIGHVSRCQGCHCELSEDKTELQ